MHAAITEQRLPLSRGLVSDFARKLSPATKRQIETLLLNFRNRTGIEVAVVTISFADLQGYPIEEYALQLGRQWGVGRDSEKRALLLLVAIKPPNSKGVYSGGTRLEVSRQLEGDVPDILAGELIRKMRDGFEAGRFDQALTTGTQTILATLAQRLAVSMEGIDLGQAARQPVRQPVGEPALAPTPSQTGTSFYEIIIFLVFWSIVGLVIYAIYRGLLGAGRLFESADLAYPRGRSLVEDPEVSLNLATGGGADLSTVVREWNEARAIRLLTTGEGSSFSGRPDSSSEGGGGGYFGGLGSSGGWSSGGGGSGSDFGGFGGGGDFGGGGASDSW
ncbi:MAG: TPM domain-containing protein [Blastocatellia bacterium]